MDCCLLRQELHLYLPCDQKPFWSTDGPADMGVSIMSAFTAGTAPTTSWVLPVPQPKERTVPSVKSSTRSF